MNRILTAAMVASLIGSAAGAQTCATVNEKRIAIHLWVHQIFEDEWTNVVFDEQQDGPNGNVYVCVSTRDGNYGSTHVRVDDECQVTRVGEDFMPARGSCKN